jgi:hypothetical protein
MSRTNNETRALGVWNLLWLQAVCWERRVATAGGPNGNHNQEIPIIYIYIYMYSQRILSGPQMLRTFNTKIDPVTSVVWLQTARNIFKL